MAIARYTTETLHATTDAITQKKIDMNTPVHSHHRDERLRIATQAMCALIGWNKNPYITNKKYTVDNAIAYADLLLQRIEEVPTNAQDEAGQKGEDDD